VDTIEYITCPMYFRLNIAKITQMYYYSTSESKKYDWTKRLRVALFFLPYSYYRYMYVRHMINYL